MKKTKYMFSIYAGATPDSKNSEYWDGDIVWITPADYKTTDKYISCGAKSLTKAGYNASNTTIVPAGSIIVSKRAPIGTVSIAEVPLCTNQGCLSCVLNDDVDSSFAYYALSSMSDEMQVLGAGTTFKEISANAFANMKIPYFPLPEQQAIVRYLDSKCSAIDEAIERHKKIIEKLEEYWKSVVWTEINSHVDTTGKLKILFELHRGYDLTANSFVNGSVPVYGSGGFVGYHNEAKCVGPNVVIGRSGSTGKLTYVPDAVFWAHNTGIYVSDFRRNIPKYVYYLLLTIDIDSLANKTAVPTLDRKNVQNYVASFTTNTEQQNSIVDKLDVLYESIQKSKTIHEKSITKLEEYRKSIIYNAVTGKIDCRTEAVE